MLDGSRKACYCFTLSSSYFKASREHNRSSRDLQCSNIRANATAENTVGNTFLTFKSQLVLSLGLLISQLLESVVVQADCGHSPLSCTLLIIHGIHFGINSNGHNVIKIQDFNSPVKAK